MKNDAIILKPDQIEAEWYSALIEECKAIITEAIFTSRWALVEGYHALGKRILEEHDNFDRAKVYGEKIGQRVAESLGISRRTISYAVDFARKYPDLSKVPGGKNITWHKICNQLLPAPKETEFDPMPSGKYRIIYADPPWKYGDELIEGYGAAEHHYPTMSIKELCAMPLPEIEDNAILFLWVTSPMLENAFPIIRAWGFEYKTSFVWNKKKHNYGHYNSVRHEFLLLSTKGSCLPDIKELPNSVIEVERTERHSQKPDEARRIIDHLYPKGKRIELFARSKTEGWETWGNE